MDIPDLRSARRQDQRCVVQDDLLLPPPAPRPQLPPWSAVEHIRQRFAWRPRAGLPRYLRPPELLDAAAPGPRTREADRLRTRRTIRLGNGRRHPQPLLPRLFERDCVGGRPRQQRRPGDRQRRGDHPPGPRARGVVGAPPEVERPALRRLRPKTPSTSSSSSGTEGRSSTTPATRSRSARK